MVHELPWEWSEYYFPLNIRAPWGVTLERVMIGRLELVSANQRQLIRDIAANPPDLKPLIATYYKELGAHSKAFNGMTVLEIA